jgi:hypothetical protein
MHLVFAAIQNGTSHNAATIAGTGNGRCTNQSEKEY